MTEPSVVRHTACGMTRSINQRRSAPQRKEGRGSGCRAEVPISNTCFRFPAEAYLFESQHARGIKAGAACVPAIRCTLPVYRSCRCEKHQNGRRWRSLIGALRSDAEELLGVSRAL